MSSYSSSFLFIILKNKGGIVANSIIPGYPVGICGLSGIESKSWYFLLAL